MDRLACCLDGRCGTMWAWHLDGHCGTMWGSFDGKAVRQGTRDKVIGHERHRQRSAKGIGLASGRGERHWWHDLIRRRFRTGQALQRPHQPDDGRQSLPQEPLFCPRQLDDGQNEGHGCPCGPGPSPGTREVRKLSSSPRRFVHQAAGDLVCRCAPFLCDTVHRRGLAGTGYMALHGLHIRGPRMHRCAQPASHIPLRNRAGWHRRDVGCYLQRRVKPPPWLRLLALL